MIRFLYNRYRERFLDLFVEDFYGQIPSDLKEPALDFLSQGKEKLDKFFQIHAYHLQRRAMADLKNANIYQGMLIEVKALSVAIAKAKKPQEAKIIKREKDPTEHEKNISSFLEEGKKRTRATAEVV